VDKYITLSKTRPYIDIDESIWTRAVELGIPEDFVVCCMCGFMDTGLCSARRPHCLYLNTNDTTTVTAWVLRPNG